MNIEGLLKLALIDPLEARILLAHALQCTRVQLVIRAKDELTPQQVTEVSALFMRRMQGEPVAYLVGTREFYGLKFDVTPDVLIPRPETELLVELASERLPKGGGVGFELMENQKLGTSQFLEQVNFQRALEGELARTIQALANVQAARVHLAMPKASVFLRDQQKPTASVMLNLHPGRPLEPQQVSAIVHLVASSVPELPVANVTVVDQNGNLLSDTSKPKGANQLDPTQLKYVEEMQQSIARRIESILTPIVGPQNVHAQEPTMGAEDFAYMLQAKPGAYCFIANGDGSHREMGHGMGPCMLHNPSYDFNDDVLPLGATYWVKLAEAWLARPAG